MIDRLQVEADAGFGLGGFVGAVLRVEVRGTPRPQPRPRFVVRGGRVAAISTTGPAVEWKRRVLGEVHAAVAATGWLMLANVPVQLRMLVKFPTKDATRWGRLRIATRNADFDNVAKLIADAITTQRGFDDDGQVAVAAMVHVWAPEDQAGVVIELGEACGGVSGALLQAWQVEVAQIALDRAKRRVSGGGRGMGSAETTNAPCGASGAFGGAVPDWLG